MELEITEQISESSKLRFIATPVVFEKTGYFYDSLVNALINPTNYQISKQTCKKTDKSKMTMKRFKTIE